MTFETFEDKKQQGNPRVALPNLTLNKHPLGRCFPYSIKEGEQLITEFQSY